MWLFIIFWIYKSVKSLSLIAFAHAYSSKKFPQKPPQNH
ncbi:hypothetical protein BCAH1134_C0386 (plasmid) [Bacillus cereus AH1134]|nr:hypothetical protein BCAH1134_C0386 [Bacillus cereus AH1134]